MLITHINTLGWWISAPDSILVESLEISSSNFLANFLLISSSKDQLGASGIRAVGWRGKREMKEENKHESRTKQIAGSNSIKSDVFKRKY